MTDEIVDGIALLGSPADARERLAAFGGAGLGVAAVSIVAPGAEAAIEAMASLVA